MKILIDTYGSDNGINPIIQAGYDASKNLNIIPCFIGDFNKINDCIIHNKFQFEYEIIDAKEYIDHNDDPVISIRKKKNSTISVGCNNVKKQEYNGFISCGSTGALLAGATFLVGRISGIKRANLLVNLPSKELRTIMIDSGANVDCKEEFILEFAKLGSIYTKEIKKIENPTVGLLNIGVEEHKGNKFSRNCYNILSKSKDINFIGNIESRDIFYDKVDIVVCDGFYGNIALKSAEGIAYTLLSEMKEVFKKNIFSKLAYILIKNNLKTAISKYNYSVAGATPLLGITETIFKAHGNSDRKSFYNGICKMVDYIEKDITNKLIRGIENDNR